MMLLYSAALTLALAFSAPWWLVRMATTGRYREGLRERLGRVPPRLREFLAANAPDAANPNATYPSRTRPRVLWLHAVSVGEVLASTRLLAELESALPHHRIVLSTTTRTGQALARERFGAARVFYFPLDFAFAVRAYLDALQPDAVLLMESELWPRLLHECARRNIPVAIGNARVSDRSLRRTLPFKSLWRRMARHVTLWLAQSDEDARRLAVLGIRADAVLTTGNLKYDIRAPQQSRIAELIREAAAGRPIIVAGSTLGEDPSEDSPLIRIQQALPADRKPLLVLAPRHPENFSFIYSMAIEYPTLLASEMLAGKTRNQARSVSMRESETAPVEIVVLDTIGDLAAVYAVADIAFIGGSLVRRGGHNPLEPAQFGVPVVMGPSFENFRDIVARMRAADAIRIAGETLPAAALDRSSVKDPEGKLRDELEAVLLDLLAHRDAARALGSRGRAVFESQQGTTTRAVAAILKLLDADGGHR